LLSSGSCGWTSQRSPWQRQWARSRLLVYSKPKVAILSTGDEIVDIDVPPSATQIRNSNSYSLAAQVQAAGGEPVLLPIAPDEPANACANSSPTALKPICCCWPAASQWASTISSNKFSQSSKQRSFSQERKSSPAKPVVFGRVPSAQVYFFGLPGNPVSTMVTFELFARPMIDALVGIPPRKLAFLKARLKSEIKTKTGLKRFLPAMLSGEFENAEVELAAWQGSGDIVSMAKADCYVVIPPNREKIAAGELVAVMMR
jgi:molybdopterin molybdotransferase